MTERKRDEKCMIVIMDLNGFKIINDTYGHSKGDEIIKIFAKILKEKFSPIGMCFRRGGDEFALIVNGECIGKFEEMKNQGLINKNASPEEAIAEYSKIFVESMKQGAFKNSKEFENAVGDIANDLGKGFDKKNIKEQRQLLKKHRMADERRMQAELNECKKISSKAERIKAENRIRLRHQFARRGQFLEMSVQKDSKVAIDQNPYKSQNCCASISYPGGFNGCSNNRN